jgi:diguanylate cyclase (GGDEF)-like protein
MIAIFTEILVILGCCILVVALGLVRKLIAQLPSGSVRRRWHVLKWLVALFVLGYLSYGISLWGREMIWLDMIVPSIFFFGAVFVWLTARLSLQTASDLRRMLLLEQESITDSVMGIFNRRYLDRRLEEEFQRSRRYAAPLSILLLDIDHFKAVNDTYGHQTGDFVLNGLGRILLQNVRPSDIVARYGGEEVMIIAPNTDVSSAHILAERLRQNIETHGFEITDNADRAKRLHVTVSIGLTFLAKEDKDTRRLVQNADRALYRAKGEGRNRTVVDPYTACTNPGSSDPASQQGGA